MKKRICLLIVFIMSLSFGSFHAAAQKNPVKKVKLKTATTGSSLSKKSLQKGTKTGKSSSASIKKTSAKKNVPNPQSQKSGANSGKGKTVSNGKLSKNKKSEVTKGRNFNTIQKKQLEINQTLAKKKGNWTLPFKSTETEANRLGRSYVGPNAKTSENGRALINKEGTKLYRKPQYKPKENKKRANFQRGIVDENGKTKWVSNAHLDIKK